jgi:hypothetical protein
MPAIDGVNSISLSASSEETMEIKVANFTGFFSR